MSEPTVDDVLDALVALGYVRTRVNADTGTEEYYFDYEKCVAAAGGRARVGHFLGERVAEYLKERDREVEQ
jgi:hypothetical protein